MHRKFSDNGNDLADPRQARLRFVDLVLTRLLYFLTAVFLIVNSVLSLNRANGNNRILRILIDCTQQGHTCYDEQTKHTGKLIIDLDHVIVISAYCSHVPENDTEAKVEACVRKNL